MLQAPQQFNGKVLVEVQRARLLEAPKNLHHMVPKSRSIIAQQYVDGYAFFHVHCSTKSQENPKGPKFSILKFFIRKKCVCSIVPAGQYFSNLKGSNLRVTDQCQDQSSTVQHLSDFFKMFSFYNFMSTASFRTLC